LGGADHAVCDSCAALGRPAAMPHAPSTQRAMPQPKVELRDVELGVVSDGSDK